MIRIILAVSALTVAVAALAPAAPAPSYFPLAQGATWVRKAEDGATITATVTGAKVVGSVRCTVIETKTLRDNRERVTKTCYEATASGVFVIEAVAGPRTIALDPPRPLLLLPPTAGKSWTWSPKDSPIDIATLKITVRFDAGVPTTVSENFAPKSSAFTPTIMMLFIGTRTAVVRIGTR